jgi:hypothetical protein
MSPVTPNCSNIHHLCIVLGKQIHVCSSWTPRASFESLDFVESAAMRVAFLISLVTIAMCLHGAAFAADPPSVPVQAGSLVGQRLVEMFQAGFGRGTSSLKEARRIYDAAIEDSKGDPRVEYAFGLVLLKQLKNKDAQAQFHAATRSPGQEYLPAWQALVWSHLVARDYVSGYAQLREFARRLSDPKSQVDQAQREESAEWIGRVIAALQKSVDTVKQREALLREDETLKEILGPALQPFLARGKADVHSLHALMEEDVQQTREVAQAKEQKERAEKEFQVAKELEASAEKRDALKKSAEELKTYLDERLAAFDKQLTRMERDYEFLQKRILSITASQVQVNAEMGLLSEQLANVNNNNRNGAGQQANIYQQRMAVLEVQSIRYQLELDQSLAATVQASQRAQALVGQRAAAIQQYERATGQVVKQDSALNLWQDRLKKDGEKLKAPGKRKLAPVVGKIQQARSFRTYVELDLVLERDRVLDSFGVAIPDQNAGK